MITDVRDSCLEYLFKTRETKDFAEGGSIDRLDRQSLEILAEFQKVSFYPGYLRTLWITFFYLRTCLCQLNELF